MLKKIITCALWVPLVIFIAWIALSFVDVATDNTTPGPDHSKYNIFSVCLEAIEK